MPVVVKTRSDTAEAPKKEKPVKRGRKDSLPPSKKRVSSTELARKFKRITELPDDAREVLHGMFSEKRAVSEITATMRQLGHFTDVKDGTLNQYLYRYKWEVVDKQIIVQAELLRKDNRARLLAEVAQSFDVLQEVSELIVVQKGRVGKMLAREKDMPMLFNSLGGELKTLAGFVQQYADLSFELGTLKRAPQITKITKEGEATLVESAGKDHVQFNLQNAERVEQAAKAFFDALEPLEVGDDQNAQTL